MITLGLLLLYVFRFSHELFDTSIASWSDQDHVAPAPISSRTIYHVTSSLGDETTETAPTQLKCDGYIYIYTYKRELATLHN